MNAKTTLVAAALTLLAGAAAATEVVQIPAERGTLTRAEVQAELARARAAGELISTGDSYGLQWATPAARVAAPAALAGSRNDVREAVRSATRRDAVASFYVGG
ncbi:MAG: DUF4148 domain-containing protein [Piscinibacter sp.]|nr:DUF4148 domain-containing protein [Piscinibacter sp.]